MNSKILSKIGACLFLFTTMFLAACEKDESENQPPKTERPKLVTKKWHLDTAHFRGLYKQYIDFTWEKFADSEAYQVANISNEEIAKNRKELEASIWDKCNEEIKTMFFDFKPDGTYTFRYRGGGETGTYQFTPSMDSIRLKSNAVPNGYNLAVPVLSNAEMKLTMRWPVVTATKASDERWYEVNAKFIPIK